MTSLVQQSIAALPLTQSYTREEYEAGRFQGEAVEAQKRRLSQHGSELAYGFAIAVIFGFGAAMTAWLGAQAGAGGSADRSANCWSFSPICSSFTNRSTSCRMSARRWPGRRPGRGAFLRFLTRRKSVPEAGRPSPKLASAQRIVFRGVSFAYEPGREVLREVTFSLQRGETAALGRAERRGQDDAAAVAAAVLRSDGRGH